MTEFIKELDKLTDTAIFSISPRKLRKGSLEYDIRNKKIVQLYLKHRSYNEICKELDITVSTVKRVIQTLISDWQKQDVKKLQAYRWEELQKINLIEEEMWEAWYASKAKPKKVTMNAVSGQILRDASGQPLNNGAITPSRKRQEVTEEERVTGDMSIMETIKWCSKSRRDLLGLDLPKKFVETADIEGTKSKAEFTRDEIMAKIEKLAHNGLEPANSLDYIDAEVDVPETHALLPQHVESSQEN